MCRDRMSVAGRDIFTVGHSTHEWETFLGLLKLQRMTCRIDVQKEFT